jgi:hypothetical protein
LQVGSLKVSRPLLIIAGLALLQFAPAIWSGGVLLPLDLLHHVEPFAASIPETLLKVKNPHLSDLVTQFYPWMDFMRAGGGFLPLWNPYSFCGSPLVANGQTTLLFPLTWLALVLPMGPATLGIAIGKLLFCGTFAFLFYRKIGLRESASLLGSLTYMFSGHLTAWLGYPGSFPIVTLPFLFWSLEKYLEGRRRVELVPVALAYGLLFIAGQPQTGLVIALGSLLYFIVRVRVERLPPVRSAFHLSVAAIAGFCLASPQLLPFLEYMRESAAFHLRSSLGWKEYPWFTLISWALPRFFGDLRTENFWGFSSHLGEAIYIGTIPLILATVGAVVWRRSRYYSAIAAVFILGVVGLYIEPAQRVFSHVPLLSSLDNNKLLVLVTFGLTSSAAAGLNEIVTGLQRPFWKLWVLAGLSWSVIVISGFVHFRSSIRQLSLMSFELREIAWSAGLLVLGSGALWAFRSNRIDSTKLAGAFLILTVVDLFYFSIGYYPAFSSEHLLPSSRSLDFLRQQAGESRFMGLGSMLPPELSVLYRVQDSRGYDALTPYRHYRVMGRVDSEIHDLLSRLQAQAPKERGWMSTTLFYRSLERYTGSTDPKMIDALRQTDYWSSDIDKIERPNLLSIMGIRYVLCQAGNLLPERARMHLVHTSDAEIWENPGALPKAFISTRPVFVQSDDAALDAISDLDFDFARRAVIHAGSEVPIDVQGSAGGNTELIPVKIVSYSSDEVKLSADSPQGGWLVLSDLYFPGWQARIDGKEVRIFPANYLFRGVYLEPGNHKVEFTYRPISFYAGAILCLVTLISLAGFGVRRLVAALVVTQPVSN